MTLEIESIGPQRLTDPFSNSNELQNGHNQILSIFMCSQ